MEEAFVSTQQPTFLDDENEEMSMPCKSEQFGLPGMLDEDLDVVVFQPSQFSIDLVREEDFELSLFEPQTGQSGVENSRTPLGVFCVFFVLF